MVSGTICANLMTKYKIDLNDASNGMWLLRYGGKGRPSQLVHRGNGYHSHAMSNALYEALKRVRSAIELRNKLAAIKQLIEDGNWAI